MAGIGWYSQPEGCVERQPVCGGSDDGQLRGRKFGQQGVERWSADLWSERAAAEFCRQ